jgi:hypothetical protein
MSFKCKFIEITHTFVIYKDELDSVAVVANVDCVSTNCCQVVRKEHSFLVPPSPERPQVHRSRDGINQSINNGLLDWGSNVPRALTIDVQQDRIHHHQTEPLCTQRNRWFVSTVSNL